MKQFLIIFTEVVEGRTPRGQLICKAAKRPYVAGLRVLNALDNLRSDPIRLLSLSFSKTLLFRNDFKIAKLCNFYLSVARTVDIVRSNVSMEHVVLVHLEKAFCNLVQAVLAKLLRIVHVMNRKNVCYGALVHILKHNVEIVLEVVQILNLDQFIALQVSNQTGFVDH